MRKALTGLVVIGLLLGLARVSQAGGDEVTAIIDKAIKAHGVKEKDKTYAYRGKNKGTLHVSGLDLEFTQEITVQVPGKFKEVMSLTVMGQPVNVTTVFNGKEGWVKANDKDIEVTKDILNELKEVANVIELSQGMFLKDKSLKTSALGELKVNDKATVGIKVSKEGRRDVDFYFDKTTGLLTKVSRRALDVQSGQEVTEDRIITEYKEVDGRKLAKKVEVQRDGKAFLEVEVVEGRVVDRVDDQEFAKPN
jgi:hypothetical protein